MASGSVKWFSDEKGFGFTWPIGQPQASEGRLNGLSRPQVKRAAPAQPAARERRRAVARTATRS